MSTRKFQKHVPEIPKSEEFCTSIRLAKRHAKFIQENNYNLSRFVRAKLDAEILKKGNKNDTD
jgi:hypothetical protein